ncbi:hypothetical protein FPOAC2_07135 [Fusarium poae]|uniref:Prion-inhibition and propagation HeLo domain-containing protein n=1 Tax=Fusarium poae TaxID=36050 RepID=A0A1B8AZL1_FUSPO|nr:hypothetical protein FPOAC1_006994 [Fusarium poae]KAG8673679.1 hypothetical protein FPOAC1_006994 [Fusarium poae]OBS25861.1 hypothetical protein FPOA_06395 [Fusarium poae]
MAEIGPALELFRFVLDTLGRIQLARNFEDDFEACQLKLDILQLRLTRWKEVVDLSNDNELDKPKVEDGKPPSRTIKEVLTDIQYCFDRSQRTSRKDKVALTKENQEALEPESNLPSDIKSIRRRLMQCIRKRQSQASNVIEGLKWVFYKKEAFDQFIGNMTDLLDELEKISPGEDNQQLYKLSEEECGDITKINLLTLKESIEGCDPWLSESVEKVLQATQAGTQNIYQSNNRGFTVGNHNGDNKGFVTGANGQQTNHF